MPADAVAGEAAVSTSLKASLAVSSDAAGRGERGTALPSMVPAGSAMDGWTVLWLGGVLGVLVWMLAGELSLIRLARRSASVRSGPWATTLGRLRSEGQVPRRVRVLESESSIVPMTHGVARPLVLLPSAGRSWPAVHRRDVLLHELAHVRRRDGFTHGVARLACVLHWFNPLVWIALQRTRVEREHACDDAVLAAGSPASSYASSLLATARSLRVARVPASAGLAMAAGSSLGDRLRAILDAGRRRSRPRPAVTGALLLSSLVLALPLAALAPSAEAGTAGGPSSPGSSALVRRLAAPAASQQVQAICPAATDGRARTVKLTGTMSITGRGTASNGEDQWVVWTGADCSVVIHATGEPGFDATETDVSALPDGARFEIRHTDGRTERVYEVRPGDSGLVRRYTVDGRDAPLDGAFERWRAALILEFIRRSGWDAEARTLRILGRSGVRGVLDEVEYLESDRVAGLYLRTLLGTGEVGAGDVARVLETTGTRIESDRETGRVLAAVPSSLLGTETARRAFVGVIAGIESDREKAKAIGSLLESGSVGPSIAADLLGVAQTVGSDRELANLLVGLAERGVPAGSDGAYIAAATTIESDREKARVLAALLDRGPRAAATVRDALNEARTIASDRELGRFLTGLLERGLVTEEVRPSFDAALETIESERERNRVLAALGRRTI
jgi:beta-lactamase regulating signal transducer with metallopeptidase domain